MSSGSSVEGRKYAEDTKRSMIDTDAESSDRALKSRFVAIAAAIVLLALLLRAFYLFDAKVENPIAGDINQYVLYAWNMTHADTFSSTLPSDGPIIPDSYRGPGYPAMLAVAIRLAGNAGLYLRAAGHGRMALVAEPATWIAYTYVAQAILGALTVLLAIAVARFWLGRSPSLCVGVLTALWPHLISFTGVLLSETLFGFVLLLAVWLLLRAQRRNSVWLAAGSGLTFAAAYLVNPLIALFPLVAGGALLFRRQAQLAVVLVAIYLIGPSGWALRNAAIPRPAASYERAAQNFVQGSWPIYLDALNARFSNPIADAVYRSEADEEQAFLAKPSTGLRLMADRMKQRPGYYLTWYLLKKPFSLWDWGVHVGSGDIYFLVTPVSPFTHVPALKWMKAAFEMFNPLFFALALLATLVIALRFLRRSSKAGFAEGIIALLLLYLTAIHTVLQAEPRYSVPYRPEELLMAVTAAVWLVDRIVRRHGKNEPGHARTIATPAE